MNWCVFKVKKYLQNTYLTYELQDIEIRCKDIQKPWKLVGGNAVNSFSKNKIDQNIQKS